jgi:hypothetical protein
MPSHVSTVGAEQDLARAVEELRRELSEAHRRETATAEILRVISTSPTNLQSVLDAVVKSAARFCGAPDASIFRLDGDELGVSDVAIAKLCTRFQVPKPSRGYWARVQSGQTPRRPPAGIATEVCQPHLSRHRDHCLPGDRRHTSTGRASMPDRRLIPQFLTRSLRQLHGAAMCQLET